jgi:hypothetical protein
MTQSKRFLLRLDPRLFNALRQWAADDLRSVNAQIEYLLAERARRAGRLPGRRATPTDGDGPSDGSSADDGDDARLARRYLGTGETRGRPVPLLKEGWKQRATSRLS